MFLLSEYRFAKQPVSEKLYTGVILDRLPHFHTKICLLRAASNLALNTSREAASTASLGNLCQCFTTLMVMGIRL